MRSTQQLVVAPSIKKCRIYTAQTWENRRRACALNAWWHLFEWQTQNKRCSWESHNSDQEHIPISVKHLACKDSFIHSQFSVNRHSLSMWGNKVIWNATPSRRRDLSTIGWNLDDRICNSQPKHTSYILVERRFSSGKCPVLLLSCFSSELESNLYCLVFFPTSFNLLGLVECGMQETQKYEIHVSRVEFLHPCTPCSPWTAWSRQLHDRISQ